MVPVPVPLPKIKLEHREPETTNDALELEDKLAACFEDTFVKSVRCASHILEGVVKMTLKKYHFQYLLSEIRGIAQKLRNEPFNFMFESHKRPFWDSDAELMASYEMIKCFLDQKYHIIDLCSKAGQPNFVTKDIWLNMEIFLTSFKPVHEAILELQSQNLTMGDFFFIWLRCKYVLEDVRTTMSSMILEEIRKGEEKLFKNEIFLAAIFMDPRINFKNTIYMSREQQDKAEVNVMFYFI